MQRITYTTCLFAVFTAATLHGISESSRMPSAPSFSRYEGILQRMPFGAPPATQSAVLSPVDAQSAAQDLKEQQLLARQINMSCVNITPGGSIAVGFTDLAMKPPVSYYLLVGSDAGGWKVLSADYDAEWAELEKEGVAIFVKLGQGLMAEPPEKKESVVPTKAALAAGSDPLAAQIPNPGHTSAHTIHGSNPIAERLAEMQKKGVTASSTLQKDSHDLKSHMERLRERKLQENAGLESEKQAAIDQLKEMARKIAKEELDKSKHSEQAELPVEEIQLTPEEAAALENQ